MAPIELAVGQSLPSTTTAEQDLKTAASRKINQTWEYTQALVTLAITAATIYAALHGIEATILNNGFLVIVATYYTRTNHTKSSGSSDTR